MKVLYLFNRVKRGTEADVQQGSDHDTHFYGMLRLPKYGMEAKTIEIEDYFSPAVCRFLRKYVLNVYFVHLPLFFSFFSYDLVFTSTAFGSQLVHALYPFKKPKWVTLDFSIMGLLGEEKTIQQKLFRFAVKRAGGIVAISLDEAERVSARFPHLKDKVTFIRLGTDTKFFKPKTSQETTDILAVGLDFGRDYKIFFEAIPSDRSVVIAARPEKMKQFGPLPAAAIVKRFSPAEMFDQYASAKIVVIPLDISSGLNDAMGCSTLIEAMAMGKAIIVTRTPTMESYVTDGENGLFVPAKDPVALKEAIELLLGDGALRDRLGNAARKFAEEHCGTEQFAAKLAEFFKKIKNNE